jgi:phage-related protein
MPAIPNEQITDSQLLDADAEIELYELTPAGSTSKFYFKNDNTVTWRNNEYIGLPLEFSGISKNAEGALVQPQLTVGQPDIDLSIFKGLIYEGNLDNARIDKHTILLTHIQNNSDIKRTETYRVRRIDSYSASQIVLALDVFTTTGPTQMPFRQYIPPAFPFVRL